jgi:hypothetical protein
MIYTVAESLALSVEKLESSGHAQMGIYRKFWTFYFDAAHQNTQEAIDAVSAFAPESDLVKLVAAVSAKRC